jgi:LCP family protein required for cell wall assembly
MSQRWRVALLVIALVSMGTPAAAQKTTSTTEPAIRITKVADAAYEPRPTEPFFVLIVGNDNRAGVGGARGDALHLVGINPAEGRATILNIPRDTYVPVPGHGNEKITHAYLFGGPRLPADAVGALVGVHVSFVVATNFAGFTGMVDELGGMDVDIPMAMDDQNSGAVFAPGQQHINGSQALAFSRNRYIPGGDIRRTEHQGLLIIYGLAKARAEASNPIDTLRFLGVLVRYTELDGIGITDLYRMARLALTFDPANVRNATMPSRVGSAGRASVVFPAPEAGALFGDFRDDAILQAH